jgi:hypothetical protein
VRGLRVIARVRYAHVVSVLAVLTASGGSAYAVSQAKLVSGKQIRPNAVTGTHIKNGTLSATAVSPAAKTELKVKGPTGPQGPLGVVGDQGVTGFGGDKGTAAQNAYAYSRNENPNVAKPRTSANVTGHWYRYAPNYGSGPTWRDVFGGYANLDLELAAGDNDGLLQLDWDSDVVAHANLMLWHHGTVHTRMECRMQIWEDQAGAITNVQTIGTPVIVSSTTIEDNVNIGLTGAITRAKGTHGVRVQCRDLDFSSDPTYKNWRSIKGNLSVVSAKTWRN